MVSFRKFNTRRPEAKSPGRANYASSPVVSEKMSCISLNEIISLLSPMLETNAHLRITHLLIDSIAYRNSGENAIVCGSRLASTSKNLSAFCLSVQMDSFSDEDLW